MNEPARVAIHYRRPPDRLRVYDQRVALEREDVIVTLSEPLELESPMEFEGTTMLEPGSLAVWFTFPGLWHDIGRFHRADGQLTGIYANVLTPVEIEGQLWHTTDLYLDIWQPVGGPDRILDEDELDEALSAGHIDADTADRAREEAARLIRLSLEGAWPPPVVHEWTLERTQATLGDIGSGG